MELKKISKKFNRMATKSLAISKDPSFWVFAIAVGAIMAPFSVATAITVGAAPMVYTGIGLASKGISKGIDYVAGGPNP